MADDIQEQQQAETGTETQVSEPTVADQIKEQMEFRLNGGAPPQEQVQPEIEKPSIEGAAAEPVAQEPAPFSFDVLKDKFGYEKPEDVLSEIEQLRKFKANPTPAEIKYENEQSEKLAKALQGGKIDEVYEFLNQQRKLEALTTAEITKDNADDLIKLGMSLKYKDLSDAEINHKFKKQFAIPKEPVLDELDDDSVAAHNEWKEKVAEIEMEKIIEAKLAKPELEAAKAKLVLPNIEAEVDEDYLQYKESLEKDAAMDAETKEAYKSFKPKDIETRVNFKDEANKIDFEFHYEPDEEGFKQSLDLVMDTQKYFEKYKGQDGSPNRKQFLQDIYFIQNKEKIIMAAMNQAKNATLKSQLPDNSQGSFQRQSPQGTEPNELHKYMQAAGVVQ